MQAPGQHGNREKQGFYTKDRPRNKIDVAVVEATEIKEDGSIVPGASVGATPELLQLADKVRG
jgi:acetyl-CoA hydrolase